jgi:hypothetical protein
MPIHQIRQHLLHLIFQQVHLEIVFQGIMQYLHRALLQQLTIVIIAGKLPMAVGMCLLKIYL